MNVEVKEYRSGYAEITIENNTGGFLLFSEKHYPGWAASIDDREAQIYKFSGIFQAAKNLFRAT